MASSSEFIGAKRTISPAASPADPLDDDNLYLEYATPKGNAFDYRASLAARLAELEAYRTKDPTARHLGP